MQILTPAASSYPRIGPAGTAICAYRADNSGGHNLGIFDIFREDIRVNAEVGGASPHEEENRFTEVRKKFLYKVGGGELNNTDWYIITPRGTIECPAQKITPNGSTNGQTKSTNRR